MLLLERIIGEGKIVESDRAKLPDGVLCRVKEPVCNVNRLNANKRKYGWDVWEAVLGNKSLQEQVAKRALFGHAEHPTTSQSSTELVSHVVCEWVVDKDSDMVYQVFDVLDTPTGRIVDCLIRAQCGVGVSTRAEGELVEDADPKTKEKFHRVVAEKYKYITTDFTADPSTFGAMPIEVKRNVVEGIKQAALCEKATAGDKQFAGAILESMLCQHSKDEKVGKCEQCGCCKAIKEAVVRVVADPNAGTANISGDVGAVNINPDATGINPGGAVQVTVTANPPQPQQVVGTPAMATPDQLEAEAEKAKAEAEEEENKAHEESETPEEEAAEHEGEDKKKDEFEAKKPKTAGAMLKEMNRLRVENATLKAERDRLAEAVDVAGDTGLQLKVAMKKIKEAKAGEGSEVAALRSKLEERAAAATAATKKLDEAATQIKALTEKVAELTVGKEQMLKENKQKIEGVEKDGRKALDEQVNKAKADATRAVVMEYANRKLAGFKSVHDNVRALLEGCKTIAEVDEVLDETRESMRKNALHSNAPKEVTVREAKTGNTNVRKQVGNAFTGMQMG